MNVHRSPLSAMGRLGLLFSTALLGCSTPEMTTPDDLSCASIETAFLDRVQSNLDVLFLIDNSPSMTPKQEALLRSIPGFIQRLDQTGADYHIAVASSDIGTQITRGGSWGGALGPACEKFEGDDGTLQRIPCVLRTFSTQAGRDACKALCADPRFVPQGGAGYISRVRGVTNVPQELVNDPMDPNKMIDIGPQKAFQCIALLGDTGCNIEGQLEGARRALDGHNPMNAGFLRPGSTLAVIFLSDEDDCSVALSKRAENTPMSIDCTPGNKDADHRCFNPDYRCIARNLECNEPLDTPGVKTGCVERATSYLEPLSTYTNFFMALRPPGRLLIRGIWSMPTANQPGGKFKVVQKDPNRGVWGLNRATDADAACYADPSLFGQAQIRLSSFASKFKGSEVSVCDKDKYTLALDDIAASVGTKLRATCLDRPPLVRAGAPACQVGDVDEATPQAPPARPLPLCGAGCCDAWARSSAPTRDDPAIRAGCQAEAADCYCAVPSSAAGVCNGGAVVGVWRKGGGQGPSGTVVSVKCEAPSC